MTKQDANILCPLCYKWDKDHFESGWVRIDVMTVCDHDWVEGSNRIEITREDAEQLWGKGKEEPPK